MPPIIAPATPPIRAPIGPPNAPIPAPAAAPWAAPDRPPAIPALVLAPGPEKPLAPPISCLPADLAIALLIGPIAREARRVESPVLLSQKEEFSSHRLY